MTTTAVPVDSAKIRSIYRSLLRELPPRPILVRPRTPIHSQLRKHFIYQPQQWNPTERKVGLAAAEQYKAYFRAQRHYVSLIEQYNPGMGMSQEERVRLSARKVGMDLPAAYDGSKKKDDNDNDGIFDSRNEKPYDPEEHWMPAARKNRPTGGERLEKSQAKVRRLLERKEKENEER